MKRLLEIYVNFEFDENSLKAFILQKNSSIRIFWKEFMITSYFAIRVLLFQGKIGKDLPVVHESRILNEQN